MNEAKGQSFENPREMEQQTKIALREIQSGIDESRALLKGVDDDLNEILELTIFAKQEGFTEIPPEQIDELKKEKADLEAMIARLEELRDKQTRLLADLRELDRKMTAVLLHMNPKK